MTRPSIEQRLDARTQRQEESGCHEWIGRRDRKGYGRTWFQGASRSVHRVAWILAHGAIPDHMQVMHSCDNPPCVNLAHLSLGTAADNQADKAAKGRARNQNADKIACPDGHPYSLDNTYLNPRGSRECRTCRASRRKKAAA